MARVQEMQGNETLVFQSPLARVEMVLQLIRIELIWRGPRVQDEEGGCVLALVAPIKMSEWEGEARTILSLPQIR